MSNTQCVIQDDFDEASQMVEIAVAGNDTAALVALICYFRSEASRWEGIAGERERMTTVLLASLQNRLVTA